MSTRWKITLNTKQRISLGTGSEKAFLTRSHPYVPGSVVRGALAAAWLREGYPHSTAFQQIFENGRFSDALPEGVAVQSQSVVRKKYGSHTVDDDRDLAFDDTPKELSEEPLKGDYDFASNFSAQKQRTVTATALEPRRHVAKDGSLFSREALEKGTSFIGTIVLPDSVSPKLLLKLTTIFVGGRSSVMGRTEVRIEEEPPLKLPEDNTIIIRTLSQAIIVDDFGVPVTNFKEALEILDIDVVKVWAPRVNSGIAGGWHAASGLPKPMEIGLAPGATAKIKRPSNEMLERLLDEGIGLRRSEGYGWIEIVDKSYERPARLEESRHHDEPEPVTSAVTSEAARILAVRLSNDQRQWLANMLRQLDEGDSLTDEHLGQPVVGRLSSRQTELVKQIVKDTPQDLRTNLAHEITRGGTR